MDINFHHFGVACRDIDKSAEEYSILGYDKGPTIFDPLQNVNICFLSHPDMPLIELLSPVNSESPVIQILDKNGTTPYHTCYETEDIEEAIKSFKRRHYIIVSKPQQACAIDGRRVAFLYNVNSGLIELVER